MYFRAKIPTPTPDPAPDNDSDDSGSENGSQQPVKMEDAISGTLGLEGGTIKFNQDGQYTLTATAINVRGKETVLSKTVTVYPVIDMTFDLPEATHTDKSVALAFTPEKLYTNHDCMYNKSNITYSVEFYFQ